MPNELVYAMSTMGEFGLEKFKRLLDSVNLPSMNIDSAVGIDQRQQVIRTLDSLGYCEFDFGSSMVYMCPPGLARLPSTGLPKAILVGARTPDLVERLKAAVKNEQDNARFIMFPQRPLGVEIPPLVCIEADSTDTLRRISSNCGLLCEMDAPATLLLATISDSMEDIMSKMAYIDHDRHLQNLKFYDVEKLMFRYRPSEERICLTDYVDPTTSRHTHFYWDGEKAAGIDRTWGIFAMLAEYKRDVLLYDSHLQKMAVPSIASLPPLLARSLALSTGIPPATAVTNDNGSADIPPGYIMHVYSGIQYRIADMVARKLGQRLHSCSLKVISGGELP